MKFKIIAIDLDGTIAMHDRVDPKTWQILGQAKSAGFVILLVTGRRLNDISQIGPFESLCEAIVAEDGAAIFFPKTNSVILPFGHLAPEVIAELSRLKIPYTRGIAIAATWTPHDKEVIKALSTAGYPATLEYNKGAVMIMPPGATKGSGLSIAVKELGYSPHNVIAFGDGENDRSLFEQAELAVAVDNAVPAIKELADIQLTESNGKGVRGFISQLIADKMPTNFRTRSARQFTVGRNREGNQVVLNPLSITTENLGIFGGSGSGKSWLGGLVAEELLRLEYQIFIIDPEGDYRSMKAFPHTLLLGGKDAAPPPAGDISTLLRYSNMSIVLDLSQYERDRQIEYVEELLISLDELYAKRGKPHWILIDEIHYFCHGDDTKITKLLQSRLKEGGIAMVSYRPSMIAPSIRSRINHLMLTRFDHQEEVAAIQEFITGDEDQCELGASLSSLKDRQAYFLLNSLEGNGDLQKALVEFDKTRRKVPHIRHLHKYLRSPLPLSKQFHFDRDKMRGEELSASSISDFLKILPQVPVEALQYHLKRGDFELWIQDILHDEELARRIRKIANRDLHDEKLTQALVDVVSSRYHELKKLI